MNRVTPGARKLAARLIALEKSESETDGQTVAPGFGTMDKLRPQLAMLMGNGGFRSVTARALAVGGEEVAWLHAIHVKADGSLEGLPDVLAQLDASELLEGRVVLLARLFGLLVEFIGETLTLRLVREAWPKVQLNDLELGKTGATK
jgi:hypothetical protein